MSNSSKKMPWFLRFAPGAILRQIGLTVLALTITGILLTTIPTGQVEAQSSGDVNHYGDGDKITALKKGGIWKGIWEWVKRLGGSAGGAAVYDAGKQAFQTKPFQVSPGKIVAYAEVILTDLNSETIWWYGKSGSPMARQTRNLETMGRVLIDRDYQYYDCMIRWLYYDEEDEIYVLHPNYFRLFDYKLYIPDIINDAYNQGDPGVFYPEHEDYYKGKEGYLITWGQAEKHDVTHQFCSDVDENSRDDALAKDAAKRKLNTFKPIAYAWLEDMRYEDPDGTGSPSWTYTPRTTEPEEHVKELSTVADDCEDVEFVPLNTKLARFSYEFNKSTLFWKEASEPIAVGDEIKINGKKIRSRHPGSLLHEIAGRTIENW